MTSISKKLIVAIKYFLKKQLTYVKTFDEIVNSLPVAVSADAYTQFHGGISVALPVGSKAILIIVAIDLAVEKLQLNKST